MRYGNFQSTVNEMPAIGVAGDRASENTTIYTATNFLAGTNGVTVGRFCWRDGTNPAELVVKADPAAATSAAKPLGIVERSNVTGNYNLTSGYTMDIVAGDLVTVGIKGQYFVEADGAATIGATVYVESATGKISFTSGTGKIDSGWKAESAASAAGDIVIISNWA